MLCPTFSILKYTRIWEGGIKNRQRRRTFCFSTRVLPSRPASWSLRYWGQWAAGQAQHFSVGSGQGWWASILHPTPARFYTGNAGGSGIALVNNQNVKVVHSAPPQGTNLQKLPLEQSSSSSHSVPRSALILQLISHFPRVRYFRTPLIIFHFATGKCIEHDVLM